MKVCILGDGLTSLTLAKTLVNQGIYVDIFLKKRTKHHDTSRTLGISKSNIDFFNKNILNIEKLLWNINKIEIYSENLKDEKILNFQNKEKQLFSIVKNHELNNRLMINLKKSKFVKFKKEINLRILIKKDYKLIFNCDLKNSITKKFFHKKIDKNYDSHAYTTIIKHKKFIRNDVAIQIFTERGPLAFLPISETETSVVYSARGKKNFSLEKLISKYNNRYKIIKINEVATFELSSSNLRCYYHKNIMAFGDLLHKLHPLAGQGFNMSIRDIKEIHNLVNFKLDHGMDLDNSICLNFEKKIKHKNYLFSNSVDFVYEFFNLESNIKNKFLSKSIKLIGRNKFINNFFTKFADNGMVI
jgi:2-octaprenyl-6-methoxyphenol hydroxylase